MAGLRSSRRTPPKEALIIGFLFILIECVNLIPDPEDAWRAYGALQWALVGVMASWLPTKWVRLSLYGLCAGQAIDEITSGNLFTDGYWEYIAFIAYASITYILSNDGKREQ